MIKACFKKKDDILFAVSLTGHSGFADYGEDIVCAAVTSAVQLTANALTEILHADARVLEDQSKIEIILNNPGTEAENHLKALLLHLNVICEDYSDNIKITISEV